jgi:hypothetical protein
VKISIEPTPSGKSLPDWLFTTLLSPQPPEILIIYPTERARSATLNKLSQNIASLDTSRHITLKRFFDSLYLDFRLPNVMANDALLFSIVHNNCVKFANSGKFPLMFAPIEGRTWSQYKTERLQLLHKELSELKQPWNWERDPGVREFRKLLLQIEKQTNSIHPDMMKTHLLKSIKAVMSEDKIPFSIKDLEGIIILDHCPEFSEIDRELLKQVSKIRPIHQLCTPGSFRLGYHGAYIEDVGWTKPNSLPSWIPMHDIWKLPKQIGWQSPIGISRSTTLHRVSLERKEHSIDAAFDMIRNYVVSNSGKVLVIDGAVQSNIHLWARRLDELGLISNFGAEKMQEQPTVTGLLSLLQIGEGLEAWSFERLRRLVEGGGLPISFDNISKLIHPKNPEWKPTPHIDVLEKISRSFHVLGGPGAIYRWMSTLGNATPLLGDDFVKMSQKLEETQWWLSNIIRIWAPLYKDAKTISGEKVIGCSSAENLPTIDIIKNGTHWFNEILSSTRWDKLLNNDVKFTHSLSALQKLNEEHHRVFKSLKELNYDLPYSGEKFIQYMGQIISKTKLTKSRIESDNLLICTPEEAYGLEADLILLVGLDVDSWSMKAPRIPWLDSESRLKLGILNSDIEIRKGRHQLRHILNAAKSVIIFDSSADESAGPSAPLAEWLDDFKRAGLFESLSKKPDFIPQSSYQDGNSNRPWHLTPSKNSENKVWLTPRPFTMVMTEKGAIGERSGIRGRDIRQRSGLALSTGGLVEVAPISISNLANAHEFAIYNDRLNRQPSHKNIEKGEYLKWEARQNLVTIDKVVLRPTKSQIKSGAKDQEIWPHLGMKGSRGSGPAIDPRPLPIFNSGSDILQSITGETSTSISRKVWSASRIQSWLTCPRQVWLEKHLKATILEEPSEDIDSRTRGLLIHDIEAAILEEHGIIIAGKAVEKPTPLHLGPLNSVEKLWNKALEYLQNNASWLSRSNAVAHHRCRDIIGVTSADWNKYLDGDTDLQPIGRIGRMLQADFELKDSAPIACEWELKHSGRFIRLTSKSDDNEDYQFDLFGRIDRVDCVILSDAMKQKAISDGILSHSNQQRWIIIRDLKSLEGPKDKDKGDRHRRGIFDEVQLALYAKAWQKAHPNDRVVGIGISEIGETTTHYVELDSTILQYVEGLALGELTNYTSQHHRYAEDDSPYSSNGFQAWLDERLRTSTRALKHADAGFVQPTPGKHCSYCSSRRMCPSAELGGDEN